MNILSKIKSLISKKEEYDFLTQVSEYDLITNGKEINSPEVANSEILLFLYNNTPFVFKYNRYFDDWKSQYIRKTHNYFYTSLKENPEQYYSEFINFIKLLDSFLSRKKIKMEQWYHSFHYIISKDELANFKALFFYHYFQAPKNKVSKMLISKENLNIIFLLACALKAHNIVDFLINTEFDEFKSDIILNMYKAIKKGQYQEKNFQETLSQSVPCENIDINIKEGEALYVAATNKNNELVTVLAKRSDLRIDFNQYEVINKVIKTGNFNILKLLNEKYEPASTHLKSYHEIINVYAKDMLSYKEAENIEMVFVYLAEKNIIDIHASNYLTQAIKYEFPIIIDFLFKHNIKLTSLEDIKILLNNSNSKVAFLNMAMTRKALFINQFLESKEILNQIIDHYKTNIQHIKLTTTNPHLLEILIDSLLPQYLFKRINKESLMQYVAIIYEKQLENDFQKALSKIEKALIEETSSEGEIEEKKHIRKL